MSNKSDLQQHNVDLSNILSIADGLPLEEVIKALASQGQYVWKKYKYTPKVEVTNPQFIINTNNGSNLVSITNSTMDLTRVDMEDFLIGFIGSNKSLPKFVNENGLRFATSSTQNSQMVNNITVLDETSAEITLLNGAGLTWVDEVMTYTGIKTTNEIFELENFVVDNSSAAYPDGGLQDGYWYERAEKRGYSVSIGDVTPSSNVEQITVNHDLKKVPMIFFIYPTSETSRSNYGERWFYPYYANGNSKPGADTTAGYFANFTDFNENQIEFTLGSGYYFQGNLTYRWAAIA